MLEENLNNEQINENETNEEALNPSQVYIDALNELKAKSVPKTKYEELRKERDGLVEALKTGQQVNLVEPEEKVDIDELRKELYGDPDKQWRPTEYVEKTLKLRDAVIEAEERDPFLPNGIDYKENPEDIRDAETMANAYRECLEYAKGDDQLFVNELMRRTKDDSPIKKATFRR